MTSEISPPPRRHRLTARRASGGRGAGKQPRQALGVGPGSAWALLVSVLVTAPGCLVAVLVSPESARAGVAWYGAVLSVLLCAAVTGTAHGVLTARRLRADLASKTSDLDTERALSAHFADVTVPVLVEKLRSGASAQTALAAVPTVVNHAHQRVLHSLATEVHRSEGQRAAAMSACANAAGRVQAMATSMAADLREMEHRHADEEVLGDLLHLDHRTAQVGRLADSIALLTGARSGRRWTKPIRMESILRGAMGRIAGYQRVRLHTTSEVAIAGHAAEGVMHALAELMDNAANFSPPTSEVHVYVEEVSAGVVITVEDGGLVMGEEAQRRAEQAVSPDRTQDLTTLSGTRLGLAVVGRLARKHGLSVSFRPSAHGGTGVLLRIPQTLVSQAAQAGEAAERGAAPSPARAAASASPARPSLSSPPSSPSSSPSAASPSAAAPEAASAGGRAPEGATRAGGADDAPAAPSTGEVAQRPGALPRRHPARAAKPSGPTPNDAEPSGTPSRSAPITGSAPAGEPHTAGRATPGSGAAASSSAATSAAPGASASSPEPAVSSASASGAAPTGAASDGRAGGTGGAGGPAGTQESSGNELPKRRRGQTLAATQRTAPAAADRPAPPARPAEQSGSRFGAFRRAVQGGNPPEETGGDGGDAGSATSSARHTPPAPRPEDDTE